MSVAPLEVFRWFKRGMVAEPTTSKAVHHLKVNRYVFFGVFYISSTNGFIE